MHMQTEPGVCRIRFWGVRGSIPAPGPKTVRYGGNTSCIEVRADNQIVVLDAGTGIRLLGQSLAAEFGREPLSLTLLITHTHWDHIQGFPFFLPAYRANNSIRILGYEGARASLYGAISGQMESAYFPVRMTEMPGNIVIEELRDETFAVGDIAVQACRLNHPGVAMGYRLNTSGGSVAFLPDNEPRKTNGGSVPAAGVDQRLVEFVRGVDVLVMDAQYSESEYETHVGWGHGSVEDAVELAAQAGVKRYYMFHHDPDHDDSDVDNLVARARSLVAGRADAPEIEAAQEGLEVVLR